MSAWGAQNAKRRDVTGGACTVTNDVPWAQQQILAELRKINEKIDNVIRTFDARHDDLLDIVSHMNTTLGLHHHLFEAVSVAGHADGGGPITLADIKRQVADACGSAADTRKVKRIDVNSDNASITRLVRPDANPDAILLDICEQL